MEMLSNMNRHMSKYLEAESFDSNFSEGHIEYKLQQELDTLISAPPQSDQKIRAAARVAVWAMFAAEKAGQ